MTDDAEVISKERDQIFIMKGKKEIEKAFADHLASIDSSYHLKVFPTVPLILLEKEKLLKMDLDIMILMLNKTENG